MLFVSELIFICSISPEFSENVSFYFSIYSWEHFKESDSATFYQLETTK